VGAGVGAVAIALSNRGATRRVVAKRIVTAAPAGRSPSNTRSAIAPRPTRPAGHRTSSNGPVVPLDAHASFAGLAAGLPGQAGLAVAPLGSGPIRAFGDLQTAHAWSTSKVPVLTTLLLNYEHTNQVLSSQGHTYATLALEQSDNAAIEALFGMLEKIYGGLVPASAAVQQVLRTAGDQTTTINTAPNNEGFTTYGQSEWSVIGEVQFYRSLADGCLLGPHDTAYVLSLMRNVVSYQRWGAGSAGYPATAPLAFKGGWGPASGGGYQVRQTAIVGAGHRGYVVSMLAVPSSGSFADGTTMLTSLATWAREHFVLDASSPPSKCATAR
jgi:hypothetical protein